VLETFNAACQRWRELAAGLSLDSLVKKSRGDGPLDLRRV
jgi:hypothetical protein